ncbi:MAG TPA: sulfite exporter TauE/SafE family protein, partial [Chromatiaceae bacterium]|nr:sulfite exporter TauE/SafE family protein [Chromatiaceae bacterium]
MLEVHLFWILPLLGFVAGVIAGVMGVGGGIVVVPALSFLFTQWNFPRQAIMQIAASTSLAVMVVTSSSSVWAHIRMRHVVFRHCLFMIPGVLLGSYCGTSLALVLPSRWLEPIFASVVLILACWVWYRGGNDPRAADRSEDKGVESFGWLLTFIGIVVGFFSGLLGIGGGMILMPLLLGMCMAVPQAVGLSA